MSTDLRVPRSEALQLRLDRAERAFQSGVQGALYDALQLCGELHVALPAWVQNALSDVLFARLTNQKEPNARGRCARWFQRYKQDIIDLTRFYKIEDALDHGIRWIDVYFAVSLLLQGTEAGGSAYTIEASYKRFKRRQRNDPNRYYTLRYLRYDPAPMRPWTADCREAMSQVKQLRCPCVSCGEEIDLVSFSQPKDRHRCENCQQHESNFPTHP